MFYVESGICGRYFTTYAEAEIFCGENGIPAEEIYPADEEV